MPETPAQESQSLSRRSIKAAAWSVLARGGSSAIRLASSLVLTRILFPEAFGIMGIAMTVMLMVQLFTDTGTRLSIIRNPRGGEPEFLNTAWMIGIIRGIGLSIIIAVIAWPLAIFYEKPELTQIMLLLALSPFISCFENPAMALVIRELKGHRQILYDLVPQAVGFVCTVLLAWTFRTVWTLVAGFLLVSAMKLVVSYLIRPYRPRFVWDAESGREMINFGKFVLVNTMICWSANSIDGFIVGKMLGMGALGVYSIGMNLGITVEQLIGQMLGNSYFPSFSQIIEDRQRCIRVFIRSITIIMALATPLLSVLALFSEQVIGIMYDGRYAGAALALFWCCMRGLVRILSDICGTTLLAFGMVRSETVSRGIALVTLLATLPTGIHYMGMMGVYISLLLAGSAGLLAEFFFLVRYQEFPLKALTVPLGQIALVMTSTFAAHSLLHPWLDAPKWRAAPFSVIILVISAGVSYLAWRFARQAESGTTGQY